MGQICQHITANGTECVSSAEFDVTYSADNSQAFLCPTHTQDVLTGLDRHATVCVERI